MHAALDQLIADEQDYVIESALPILTPQGHVPILVAYPTNPARHAETTPLNQYRPSSTLLGRKGVVA